jgi:hypothetical protein
MPSTPAGGVEMLVLAPEPAVLLMFLRCLEVEFQAVEAADGVAALHGSPNMKPSFS